MDEEDFKEDQRAARIEMLSATRESEYSYWNALLTFNAIIISVFSALSIISQINRIPITILIICCLISSGLLIANYLARKKQIFEMGEVFRKNNYSLTYEQHKPYHEKNLSIFNRIRKKELWAALLLFPEALIIIWLVFPKLC
jgi:hypothetical protein